MTLVGGVALLTTMGCELALGVSNLRQRGDAEAPDGSGVDGGGATGLSCAGNGPGRTECGDGESCCTSLLVEGGTFHRSYALDGSTPVDLADPATISSFRLDKYLVTVGRFRAFVEAVMPDGGGTGYRPKSGSGKHSHLNHGEGLVNSAAPGAEPPVNEAGWLESWNSEVQPTTANLTNKAACTTNMGPSWTASPMGHEDDPIVCVNWYESYAFCIWDGGFLPSEAELEYAGAGGSQQRLYPWGSADPVCGAAEYYAICATGSYAPVGTAIRGGGRWGQLDLAGEVWERTLDLMAGYVSPCVDCANLGYPEDTLDGGNGREMRGGNYNNGANYLSAVTRFQFASAERNWGIGFRCARAP
jgi:formylglycine-generating enzyme required for sulfatase activity